MRVITRKDVPAYVLLDCKASQDIVTMEIHDVIDQKSAKKGEYVIQKEYVETERKNTQEYINSFKDDVGIENILKKFELTKDPTLLNQVQRPSVAIAEDGKEVIQDYSHVPVNEEEALKLAAKARQEFSALPSDLVKNRSFTEFAETCTKEELLAYISSLNKKEGE